MRDRCILWAACLTAATGQEIALVVASDTHGSLPRLQWIEAELNRLYAPAGGNFRLHAGGAGLPLGTPVDVVWVRVQGTCAAPARVKWSRAALAWAEAIDGAVQPLQQVNCTALAGYLHQAGVSRTAIPGEDLLARALARVLAHEMAHYILREPGHPYAGLLKMAVSAWELGDEDEALPEDAVMAFRQALLGLRAQQARLGAS